MFSTATATLRLEKPIRAALTDTSTRASEDMNTNSIVCDTLSLCQSVVRLNLFWQTPNEPLRSIKVFKPRCMFEKCHNSTKLKLTFIAPWKG